MARALKKDRRTTELHFRKGPMTKRTVELIIRIAIEVVDWLNIILKEKRRETKPNDRKGNSKKERESGKPKGTTSG
jgi:hypothetical protein